MKDGFTKVFIFILGSQEKGKIAIRKLKDAPQTESKQTWRNRNES